MRHQQEEEKVPTLEQVNSWTMTGKLGTERTAFLQSLQDRKLERRVIQCKPGQFHLWADKPSLQRSVINTREDIDVRFPYSKPYECQIAYIQRVVEALTSGQNAMLESPTGTGKTLCLLTACVAFMKHQREKYPDQKPTTLVYCTRTHTQIKQIVAEIRDLLPYEVNTQVLASKGYLCINTDINTKDSQVINYMCKTLRKSKQRASPEDPLVPNTLKELACACPYYQSQHVKLPSTEKWVNAVFDLRDTQSTDPYCLDVEDLCKTGTKQSMCPYYFAKSRLGSSDIVILPYQYLLDKRLRASLNFELKGSIVVFDEAHNIDKMCEDVAGFEVKSNDIQLELSYVEECLISFRELQEKDSNYDRMQNMTQAKELHQFVSDWLERLIKAGGLIHQTGNVILRELDFEPFTRGIFFDLVKERGHSILVEYENDDSIEAGQAMSRVGMSQGYQGRQRNYIEGNVVQTELYGAMRGLNPHRDWIRACDGEQQTEQRHHGFKQSRISETDRFEKGMEILLKACHLCMTTEFTTGGAQFKPKLAKLIEVFRKMRVLCTEVPQDQTKNFKGYIKTNSDTGELISFGVQCLSPHVVFRSLIEEAQPQSVILTSGTLSPLSFLETELQTSFPIKLQNNHVIARDRVLTRILTHDGSGKKFAFHHSAYQYRFHQYRELGRIIYMLLPSIQGGILLFFTSYQNLQDCAQTWGQGFANVRIFQEESNNANAVQAQYQQAIAEDGKAILMCTSRGKMSEGLNFADELARAIFVVGIPYQLVTDSRVVLKSKHYGGEWDQTMAMREVNQIIGRSLRHKDDYSCIFLVDHRYTMPHHFKKLTRWIKDSKIKISKHYDDLQNEVHQFFELNKALDRSLGDNSSPEVIEVSSDDSVELLIVEREQTVEIADTQSLGLPDVEDLFTARDLTLGSQISESVLAQIFSQESPRVGNKRPRKETSDSNYSYYKRPNKNDQ